jgi:hypothetical protein
MTKLFVGDIVALNISFDDLPEEIIVDDMGEDMVDYEAYFETTIIDLDNEQSTIDVAFHKIEDGQITAQYSIDKVKSIKREYKVMDLVENFDRSNGIEKLIAQLSRIEKIFMRTSDRISYTSLFSYSDFDTFIVPLDEYLAQTMLGTPEENIVIDFDEFTLGNAEFDGKAKPVYYFN